MPTTSLLILFVSVSVAVIAAAQVWTSYRIGLKPLKLSNRVVAQEQTARHPQLLRDLRLSERPKIDAWLQQLPIAARLQLLLTQAGLSHRADQFMMLMLLAGVLVVAVLALMNPPIWLLGLGGIGGAALPVAVALYRRQQRSRQLDQQLPDFLDSIARAMQAGNSFSGALAVVSKEAAEPIGTEFRRVFEEINFGRSVKEGLQSLSIRNTSDDVRYFVIAVLIHLQTGGSLTSLLLGLSTLIRDRQRLRKLGKVFSAEGRLSAWILALLPFGTGLVMFLVNPEFISILWTDPAGIFLLQIMFGLLAVGIIWMRKIIRFRI
jgi:tight adherence protein B